MQLQSRPSVVSAAAEISACLADQLSAKTLASCHVQAGLARLAELIECLPLDEAEYCYYRNRLTSTADLLNAGETLAARYQVREMSRKLDRLAKAFC